jgi:membrane fusion protein (multidrug efflux system)
MIKIPLLVFMSIIFSLKGENVEQAYCRVTLSPSKKAVISAPVSGRLLKYTLEEGASFKKGQLLLSFDNRLAQLEKGRLKKKISLLQAQLKYADLQKQNALALQQKGAMGKAELEKRIFDRKIAELNLSAADQELAISNHKLELTKLSAPFAGKLKKKLIREFESAQNGQPVFEIINDRQLHAQCYLPSRLYKRISTESKVTLKINGSDKLLIAKVLRKSPVIEAASQTFEIILLVDNKEGLLRSGMSGNIIDIELAAEQK